MDTKCIFETDPKGTLEVKKGTVPFGIGGLVRILLIIKWDRYANLWNSVAFSVQKYCQSRYIIHIIRIHVVVVVDKSQ